MVNSLPSSPAPHARLQVVRRVRQVRGQGLQRGFEGARRHGVEDGSVLALGLVPHGGEVEADVAVGLLAQAGEHVEGQGPVGGLVEEVVEHLVEVAPLDAVGLALHQVEHLGGVLDDAAGDAGKGDLHQAGLQRGDHLVQLAGLLQRERGNHGPSVPLEGDQSLGLQQAQGLAQGDGAHAEAEGELGLVQRFALGKEPAVDGLPQHPRDVVGGGAVSRVARRKAFEGHLFVHGTGPPGKYIFCRRYYRNASQIILH